jgi:hypothetical protein
MRSRQSARSVRTQRSAWAFAFGARIGVRITSIAWVRKISSNAWLNFRVAVADEEPEAVLILKVDDKVACLLCHPAPVGLRGGGNVLDPSRCERDEEQDVDPLEKRGLDGEEVAGKHARRMRSQEHAPR